MTEAPRPFAAASLACFRDGQVLLVRRGAPPLRGLWSLPGGRVEWGERAADAALRETREEAAIEADIIAFVDLAEVVLPDAHYLIAGYAGVWRSGEPQAGDDADDARFAPLDSLADLGVPPAMRDFIVKAAHIAGVAA